MSKLYRVKKDLPQWDSGAVLTYDNDYHYVAINDLWNTKATNTLCEQEDSPIGIRKTIVENSPDWFERIYEIKLIGKVKYLSKLQARKHYDVMYKEK